MFGSSQLNRQELEKEAQAELEQVRSEVESQIGENR